MKHKIPKTQLLLLMLLFATAVLAQNRITYQYDNAGNRVSRAIVLASGPSMVKGKTATPDSVVVQERMGSREIKIYPNPTRGMLGVEIKGGDSNDKLRLQLFAANGSMLINAQATEGLNPVDLAQQPPGIYVLVIFAGNNRTEYKIVKE